MSELTLTIVRLGLLVLLWVFVFSVVGVLRGDLYGTRVTGRTPERRSRRGRAREQRRSAGPQLEPSDQAGPEPSARPGPEQTGRPDQVRAARPRRAPGHLTVTAGPLTGTTLPLQQSGTLIGRNPEAALVLDDDFASGRHARIVQRGREWYVEDLGSTNGTFLDNARLTNPLPVGVGSVLRIGRTVIELRK